MTRKAYVWTFEELQMHLSKLLEEWATILNVEYISTLTSVDSMVSDNVIRTFIIHIK